MSRRLYYASDIHGSDVCWRKFLNAGTLLRGRRAESWAATSPARRWCRSCACPKRRLPRPPGDRRPVLATGRAARGRGRIRDMGFYPYRTTEEEIERTLGLPRRGRAGVPRAMRRRSAVAGPGRRAAGRHRHPRCTSCSATTTCPSCGEILPAPTPPTTEDRLIDLGEGITMISSGWANPTPWNSPREMDEDEPGAADREDGHRGARPRAGGVQPARPARPDRHRPGADARRLAQAEWSGAAPW